VLVFEKTEMAKRDQEETPGQTGSEKGSGASSALPKLTSFAKQLRKRYGAEVDPHVSLDSDIPDNDSDEKDLTKGDSPAKQRLDRLGNMTPGDFRYKYTEEVGRGGMGVVLKVHDRDLQRSLAMKVLMSKGAGSSDESPADHRKLTRFLEEAQITGQLDHPGVVPVHELGMDARGRPFFTMRLVRGHTLKQVFETIEGKKKHKGLHGWSRNKALSALLRVCDTIAFAHSKGVIHRDLKPSNIMVGQFGETYVMDWGLAKVLDRDEDRDISPKVVPAEEIGDESISLVRTDRLAETDMDPNSPLVSMDGDIVGTPAYMAPEQAKGELDKVGEQADVYSIGAILYHLLTGRPPYADAEARQSAHVILMRVLSGRPARIHKVRKGIPVELAAICEKAMGYSRKYRYSSVLDLNTDLHAFLEGRVVDAHETGSIAEFKKWVERNTAMAAVSAIALLALLATLSYSSIRMSRTNDILDQTNAELETSRNNALANRDSSEENARKVNAAAKAVQAAGEASLRDAYLSSLHAAHLSLRLNETSVARELLSATAGRFAGWEWEHINLLSDTSLKVWESGYAKDAEVAFSPNGNFVASVELAGNRGIELRESDSGVITRSFPGRTSKVTGLDFDSTSSYLAASSSDETVRVFNLLNDEQDLYQPQSQVADVDFSSEGLLACATATRGVQVWDTTISARDKREVPVHSLLADDSLTCVDTSPDGARIAAGSAQGIAHLWDLATGAKITVSLDEAAITNVAFSPKSDQLVVCSENGQVRILRIRNGKAIVFAVRSIVDAHATDCVFLPDGRIMASCSDGLLRVINLATPSIATVQGHLSSASSIAIDSGGSHIVTGSRDGTLRLWSRLAFEATTLLSGHEGEIKALAFSADGTAIATGSIDNTIRLWDSTTAEATNILREHDTYVSALAFSPDGEYLASGSGTRSGAKSEIRLWVADDGDPYHFWECHDKYITDLAFSPDSRLLAVASGDGTCSLWNIESDELLASLELDNTVANSIVWNTAGTRFLTGSRDGSVQEWDPFRMDKPLQTITLDASILSLCYGESDSEFVAGCLDSTVQVWSLSGSLIAKLDKHKFGVRSVDISPDGARLVSRSADGSTLLWDTNDWKPTLTLLPLDHSGNAIIDPTIQGAYFSPNGKRILSSDGRTARIWETEPPSARHDSMATAQTVSDIVNGLFNEIGLPSNILESLKSNRTISGELRRAAIRSVTLTANNPELLAKRAWETVRKPNATDKGYANALMLAQKAYELKNTNLGYRAAVASALYRTGAFGEALVMLEELQELSWSSKSEPHPEGEIFLAMAAYQLGDLDKANETLMELEPLMDRPLWTRLAGGLFEEAKSLIQLGD
jgi:WD40 repeat protein/serine/threonine protein kinase